MPNKYWGFWLDSPMTQMYENKRQYLDSTSYDGALKVLRPSDINFSHLLSGNAESGPITRE